jgi:hypothetical protein
MRGNDHDDNATYLGAGRINGRDRHSLWRGYSRLKREQLLALLKAIDSLSLTSGRPPGRAPGNPVDRGRDDRTGDAASMVNTCRAIDDSICLPDFDRHSPSECRDRESGELERAYEIPVHMRISLGRFRSTAPHQHQGRLGAQLF